MKWSKSYLYTLKDAPADAEIPSHQLMVRAGLIRKVAPGIYTYGNLALRAIRKLETIIREELNKRGCQEVLMPVVQPAELWRETNRWAEMGDGLLKFKNRNGHEFCLGATHEEVITDYVRKDIKSYRDMPANLYQIQTKYRDEIRPRFGLMRGREFIMKDAYSFDVNSAGALKNYELMYTGYQAIFDRLGLQYRIVQADAGNIGGSQTHEFQVLAEAGEDHLMVCDKCNFAANIEVAPAIDKMPHVSADSSEKAVEEFATPGLKTIADLAKATSIAERDLVKTMFFSAAEGASGAQSGAQLGVQLGTQLTSSGVSANPTPLKDIQALKPVAVLLRGSDEVNPIKLKNALGLVNPPLMLTDEEVRQVTGAWPGSCGPVGLTIPVYLDNGVGGLKNYVVGANKDGFHLRNVNTGRDFRAAGSVDIRMTKPGDRCPQCEGQLKSVRGIEVGHVFYLGSKYSKAMQANYLAQDGSSHPIEMGCYGIGVTRTVQAAIEQSHDKDGIVWPFAIAPFAVHMTVLDPDNQEVAQNSEILYRELQARGLEVLMDDRAERPGVKFKDADLLGMPIRLNIGSRGLQNGEVEIIVRKTKEMQKVKLEATVESVVEIARAQPEP